MTQTILIVDDDDVFRSGLACLLDDADFSTYAANNGRAAMSVLKEKGDEINLVITDVIMPQMDGIEFSRWVKEHYPSITILAMSGGSRLTVKGTEKHYSYLSTCLKLGYAQDTIEKPFEVDEILDKIQHLLAEGARSK